MGSSTEEHMAHLSDPTQRDKQYTDPEGKRNIAAYLVDLHHARKVFKFCGSHQFQLVLSDALLEHLSLAAEQGAGSAGQPVVFDADQMCHIPNYTEFKGSAAADNVRVFHGREVRDSAGANGGQGKVLQLCMAGGEDAEGCTPAEVADYNGWQHDSGRTWRKAAEYELDGFASYSSKFGEGAFGLHHRFFLHWDSRGVMWLSAEDGCEGEPWQGQ